MILVDTSVWADHFRRGDAQLVRCLEHQLVFLHPFVIGELALGHLRSRAQVLRNLRAAQQLSVVVEDDVLRLIEDEKLVGSGIGYIDAHLLAAVLTSEGMQLWTRDRRLKSAAEKMGLAFDTA